MLELRRLEAVLASTPERSPDYPVMLRRLAEGYVELEMLAERERARAQAAADDSARAARETPKQKLRRGEGTLM